jgi:cell division protein FtsZ
MLKFEAPKNHSSIIKVMGVGGGGNNAVNHMFNQGIVDVDFIQCNTDAQILEASPVPVKIQLGKTGLGAGNRPDIGRKAAEESVEQIRQILENNTKMLFITAGMGGGTGTGAAPVIASVARELDILTVGIVTIPFSFEGRKRKLQAEQGIEEMKKYVDTLLVINNDRLRDFYGDLKLREAFAHADDVLTRAAKGIAEIITVKAYINVDFEDVKTVMQNSGRAIMGSSTASGENRALRAAEEALSSPLLNDNDINGAHNMLLYISSSKENEITMDEVTEITNYIQKNAGNDDDIIWVVGYDENLADAIGITLLATAFEAPKTIQIPKPQMEKEKNVFNLLDNEPKPFHQTPLQNESNETISLVSQRTPEKTHTGHNNDSQDPSQPNKPIQRTIYPLFTEEENEIYQPQPAPSESLSEPEKIKSFKNPEPSEPMEKKIETKNNERVRMLRNFSYPIKSLDQVEKLENEPAYKRRNINVEPAAPSSESVAPKSTLSEQPNGPEIRSNPYLFDNPD